MPVKKRILFLEPFYGGSHRDFADGLVESSRHSIQLHTMPDRFWKWRMRGAALHFARSIDDPRAFDLLFLSDMMSLTDLTALWGRACPPSIVYFHENQMTYPLPAGQRLDYHFAFTNITTALAAERVVFNSRFHRDSFFGALPSLIQRIPDFQPAWVAEAIERKTTVLYPGCRFPALSSQDGGTAAARGGPSGGSGVTSTEKRKGEHQQDEPPLIVWNHRWEYDKDPATFFDVLERIAESGVDFRVAVLGESFQKVPKPFVRAKEALGRRIVQYGYAESRDEYLSWLSRGDIVISTAIQENFGISIVEAVRYGCFPLLPRRLSYPELIPAELHGSCLYDSPAELETMLRQRIATPTPATELARLQTAMSAHAWENVVKDYDLLFDGPG